MVQKEKKKKLKNPFRNQYIQGSFKLKLTALFMLLLGLSIFLLVKFGIGG